MDPTLAAEGFTHPTYELADVGNGVSTLTVSHSPNGITALAIAVGPAPSIYEQ